MKKIILFLTLSFFVPLFSNAERTVWVMGTYISSTETNTIGCCIGCTPSNLYCYMVSSTSSQSQGITDNFNNWQTFEQTGLVAGTPITITVYDALQNVAATYSGNYNSMELTYPADGSIVSTIHFQQN